MLAMEGYTYEAPFSGQADEPIPNDDRVHSYPIFSRGTTR